MPLPEPNDWDYNGAEYVKLSPIIKTVKGSEGDGSSVTGTTLRTDVVMQKSGPTRGRPTGPETDIHEHKNKEID